jgi:hypothetical protein
MSLKKFSPRARICPRNASPDSGAINKAMVEPTRLPTSIPIKKPNIRFILSLLSIYVIARSGVSRHDEAISNTVREIASTLGFDCLRLNQRGLTMTGF